MINLNFEIISCYCDLKTFEQKFVKIHLSTNYNCTKKLENILKEIYLTYGINNEYWKNDWKNHCDIFEINELFWSQFFNSDILYNLEYTQEDYIKMKISDLEKQFHISKTTIPVYLNYDGKGKAIGDTEGIKFFFHTNEKDIHHIPHIHCKYSGVETRINLETLKIMDKPFKKSKMKKALEIIQKNQSELINYWNSVVINGEALEFELNI